MPYPRPDLMRHELSSSSCRIRWSCSILPAAPCFPACPLTLSAPVLLETPALRCSSSRVSAPKLACTGQDKCQLSYLVPLALSCAVCSSLVVSISGPSHGHHVVHHTGHHVISLLATKQSLSHASLGSHLREVAEGIGGPQKGCALVFSASLSGPARLALRQQAVQARQAAQHGGVLH